MTRGELKLEYSTASVLAEEAESSVWVTTRAPKNLSVWVNAGTGREAPSYAPQGPGLAGGGSQVAVPTLSARVALSAARRRRDQGEIVKPKGRRRWK